MKLLKDTFIFNELNASSNIKAKMSQYSPVLDNLSIDSMDDDIKLISRRFNFPTKNRVINDLNNGRIVPVLNKERISLPNSIPAYLMRGQDGKPIAIVNFTSYVSKNVETGEIFGDPRQMFALMQTGSILLGCREHWNNLATNQEICKVGCLCYAKLMTKTLDKLYAISLDQYKADKVRYMAAKFFLINMLGKPNTDGVKAIARTVCKSMTQNNIDTFDQSLPETIYDDIRTFIDGIAVYIDGCSSLNIRTFIRVWAQMYQPSTLMAMEYLPYFFHMLFSVSVGGHLNNEVIIDTLLGKDIDRLYNAVTNIIR